MNQIKVLFFATLRDRAGAKSLELDIVPGATIGQLKEILIERHPGLKGLMEHCLASINHEYCFDEAQVPTGAEIGFFPPVSGG